MSDIDTLITLNHQRKQLNMKKKLSPTTRWLRGVGILIISPLLITYALLKFIFIEAPMAIGDLYDAIGDDNAYH